VEIAREPPYEVDAGIARVVDKLDAPGDLCASEELLDALFDEPGEREFFIENT